MHDRTNLCGAACRDFGFMTSLSLSFIVLPVLHARGFVKAYYFICQVYH